MATSSPLNGGMFLTVVSKSMLVEPERLTRAVDEFKASGGDANNAVALSEHLTAKSLITKWQSEKLLQGKHKGYFLGKYKLLSLLGKGGMSSVFLAEHTLMKRRCAIKVLPHKRVADSSYLARFHREAQAVASLDHPNIVRAYDVDQQADRDAIIHFLVMEYVEGLSLQEVIAKTGPCSLVDSVDYVRQAAVGLAHAHQAGLVHRDIKPGNLLRDNTGVVKILDLGLARFFDNQGQEEALTIQHDEKVLGTADYLAPEQALDSHTVDARADIYSLGCTLYFLLTGHPPFTEGTLTQRLMAHQSKEPPPVEKDRAEIPPTLTAIVRKMMAKKPDDRYTTAEEAAEALRKWLSSSAPVEWKKAHRQLFAGDATGRPAPVMAQVVTPVAPAPSPPVTSAPIAPPSSKKGKVTPSAPSSGPASSNIFSVGSPAEESPSSKTSAADPNLAAFFAGLGEAAPPAAAPAKSAPKLATKPKAPAAKPPAAPPTKPPAPATVKPTPDAKSSEKPAGPSSVEKKPTAPSSIAGVAPAVTTAVADADFSFLSAATPAASPTEGAGGTGLFDFLGTASPTAEPPPAPAPPPVVAEVPAVIEAPLINEATATVPPMIEISVSPPAPAVADEGLFQFGDVSTPEAVPVPGVAVAVAIPDPVPPPPKSVAPSKARPAAKVVPPEPEFRFGAPPVTDVAPIDATEPLDVAPGFDFGAPSTGSVADGPGIPFVNTESEPDAVEPENDPAPVPKKKAKLAVPAVKLPTALPPVLQNRRVQIGIAGGVGVVMLVGLAYGFGLFGGSAKAVTKKGDGKKTTTSESPTAVVSTGGKPSTSSEWARKRTATVGVTGDFKSIGDALQTAKLHFKPGTRSQSFTIKVAAGTYAERIVLEGKSWPNNIVITGDGGPIVLEPSGAEPIIKLADVEGVQISNVLLKAQGKPIAVELSGSLIRLRLQKFTLQGFSDAGIRIRGAAGLSFSDARCQIEEGQFEPGSPAATGVKIRPADGAEGALSQNILLQRLKFLGPMAAGIELSGRESASLEFRESLFVETKVGVYFLDKTIWRDWQFVNNTFYKCPNPILIAEQPDSSAKSLSFRRNLFVESGPEVFVDKGFDDKPLFLNYMIGLSRLNFSTRVKPEMPKNEIPIFGDGGQQGNSALKFASTDPKNSRFLAPAENAPQGSVGDQTPDEKPYVGAVAP